MNSKSFPVAETAAKTRGEGERGFSLTELMIALMVFTIIIGSVLTMLLKSQAIFRTEQGVSEMNQNGRLLIDFLTRDVQQAKENGLGLGQRFRSIYSVNGPEGKTDEIMIVSSDTETKVPASGLPLTAATTRPFSVTDRYVEIVPNGAGHLDPAEVAGTIEPDEEFIVSSVRGDGSIQFDFVKAQSAKLTRDGYIGLSFDPVEHKGIESEINFGSTYENGAFTIRPVTIKRYFVDRREDQEHPRLALSINDGEPIAIARNIVAFQLRYLEVEEGELDGQWVKEQNISRRYSTQAVEVTITARTEIEGDEKAERLITLASVIRPRYIPGDGFGASGGNSSPGLPGPGGPGGGLGGGPGGDGGSGGGGGGGRGGPGDFGGTTGTGGGLGDGAGYGDGWDNGSGSEGWRHKSRRVGRPPRLGERLNPR